MERSDDSQKAGRRFNWPLGATWETVISSSFRIGNFEDNNQIPGTNNQINPNSQYSKLNFKNHCLVIKKFGHWLLFGAWDLVIDA
jgi:hypothetical protein